jgi:hypothetical protein
MEKFPLMDNKFSKIGLLLNYQMMGFRFCERLPQLRITHYELRIGAKPDQLQFETPIGIRNRTPTGQKTYSLA